MNKRKVWTAALALFLAVSMIFGMAPIQAEAASSSEIKKQINELEEQQEELEEQIAELQSQYDANADEMVDMVKQKDLIDQEIAFLHAKIDLINDQIANYSLLIADKQDELDNAETYLRELDAKYKERIQTMEEEGEVNYWSIIFEANSFSDLLDRMNMVKEIAAADKRRLKELAKAAEEVTLAQEALETEKEALEGTKEELDAAQASLAEKRAEADELLLQLIAKGEEYQKMLDESEELQEVLMAEIADLEAEYENAKYLEWLATYVPPTTYPSDDRTPSSNAPSSSGWVAPLSYLNVTSPFGNRLHPILGYYRMHNGVDLAASRHQPIYAAKSGVVTVASYQEGGAGWYVSINHGDGYSSIYMHMTNYIVSAGQYVTAGQVIGYAGDSGLSKGVHLHFGISYNGTYVNPMDYIG